MKQGRRDEARLIRSLIAAIDNAEAPPVGTTGIAAHHHRFPPESAEVERLSLNAEQVQAILSAEIQEREQAAAEMDRIGRPDRAAVIRAEAMLTWGYIN